MADNVTTQSATLATIPASTKISTDEDLTNGHVQRMKLAVSADGSSTHITATADGLQVQGAAADGAAVTGNPVLIGGDDGTNAVNVAVDSDGAVHISDGGNVISTDWNGTAPPIGAGTEAAALRVTVATDSTGVLTVDNAGTFAVQSTLQANSGVDIGDVDVTSIIPGTGATNLGKAEDAAHSSGDVGIMALGVRNDTLAALAGTDGDYTPFQFDARGALYVESPNLISTNNSSTATLGISGNYTGTGDDCSEYTTVTVIIDSSHDSATDGMTFEWSTDNTNWDYVNTFTYTAANGARVFQLPVVAQYFRVNYTNGGTGQTHFRVQTILHAQNTLTSIHRLADNVDPDRSAQIMKSVLIAQQAGAGDFVAIQSTASGNLKVALEENDAGNLTTNTVQLGGTAISTGNGTTDAGTQRVTISSDSTGVISVDDNSGSLTVDNAGTFAVQVDAALPTGANTIGEVTIGAATTAAGDLAKAVDVAAGGSDVGMAVLAVRDDSLTTLTPIDGDYTHLRVNSQGALHVTGGGGGTEYVEDDAAAANPTGSAVILVRQDTPATLTSTDGDNVAQRATNYGAAFVQVLDSSGNFINSFGGSGGTSHADDAAFSIGSASSITPAGFLADDTTPDSVDEGDVGVPRMTLTRKPYAVITDATSENNAAVDGSGHLQVDIAADSVGIGGGTQYAVDTALGATPTGTLAVAIRDDALSTLTPVEGDAIGLRVDANGALWVIPSGTVTVTDDGSFTLAANSGVDIGDVTLNNGFASVTGGGVEATALRVTIASDSTGVISVDDNGGALTVDNAGTFATQVDGAALTALQLIDDIVYTDDTSTHATGTSKGAGIMAAATPTDGSVEANDIGMLAMSTDRRLHVDAQIVGQDADITIADGGNNISVDWAGTVPPIGAGTEAAALRVTLATDSTGVVSVDDNGSSITVDTAGGALDVSGATVTVDLGANNDVQGPAAHDATYAGNPMPVGYHALAHGSNPTAVAAGDMTKSYANRAGIPWVIGGHPNVVTREYYTTGAQTNDAIIDTIGAGTKVVITGITVTVDNATTVDTKVRIGFGATTVPTEPTTGNSVTGTVLAHGGIAAGSGVSRGDGSGILAIGGDGEELRITCGAPTTGELHVIVTYYTIES